MAIGETMKHQESMKQIKDSLPQWCDPHQAQVVANLKVWVWAHVCKQWQSYTTFRLYLFIESISNRSRSITFMQCMYHIVVRTRTFIYGTLQVPEEDLTSVQT